MKREYKKKKSVSESMPASIENFAMFSSHILCIIKGVDKKTSKVLFIFGTLWGAVPPPFYKESICTIFIVEKYEEV